MTKEMAIMSVNDIQKTANMVVKSGLFPEIKSEAAAMALMMLCQAEDLHPMMAVRRYHIVKGKPSMKADAMLGEFQRRSGKVEWIKFQDDEVEAVFHAPGLINPTPPINWNIDRAQKAGLLNNPTWKQYPRNMLRARVISDGIRMAMPEIISGIYTPEEVQDFAEAPKTKYQEKQEKIVNAPISEYEKGYKSAVEDAGYSYVEDGAAMQLEVTEEMKQAVKDKISEAKTEEELESAAVPILNWPKEVKNEIRPEYKKKLEVIKQHSDFL